MASDSAPDLDDMEDEPSRVGELLAGRYQLQSLLGAGGMGRVYRARNEALGRDVAVKILRARAARDRGSVMRFLREARATALVNHPNVVQILDAGADAQGIPYIVEELLEGQDLGAYLNARGGRLPALHAIEVLRPVVEAMAFAHRAGVVHRDLKPENVFLCPQDGVLLPKILDFGISKILQESRPDENTKTGVIIGTPHYMSPEQITGERAVDARADVWALGVMLHELIAGDLPFPERPGRAIFLRICLEDPVPLDHVAPGAPADLVRIILRCLRRKAEERYPSAAELARDLFNVREARPIEATQKLAAIRTDRPVTIDPAMHPAPRDSRVATRPEAVTLEGPAPAAVDELERDRSPSPSPDVSAAVPVQRTTPRPGVAAIVLAVMLSLAVIGAAAVHLAH